MRREEVHIQGGYDGEYGIIRLFTQGERLELTRQARFWELPAQPLNSGEILPSKPLPAFLASESQAAPPGRRLPSGLFHPGQSLAPGSKSGSSGCSHPLRQSAAGAGRSRHRQDPHPHSSGGTSVTPRPEAGAGFSGHLYPAGGRRDGPAIGPAFG